MEKSFENVKNNKHISLLINNLKGRGGKVNSELDIVNTLNKEVDFEEVISTLFKVFTEDISKFRLSCAKTFQVSEEMEQQNFFYIPEATL